MAQFALHGGWKSTAALASLFTFLALLVFTLAGGLDHLPQDKEIGAGNRAMFGTFLYLSAFALTFFGFWSKEDWLAILGIVAVSLLIILDVLLRVGVLSFNLVHVV